MKNLILICILTLVWNISYSQRCELCNEALQHGVENIFSRETGHSFDESVNTLYSYEFEFWEKYENYSNKSTSLDAAYKVYSASYQGYNNSETKKEAFNKRKSYYQYSRSTSLNEYEKTSQKLIDRTPFESFNNCIRDYCSNGLFGSHSITGDDIIVTVRWNLTNGDPNQTSTLQTVSLGNAKSIDYNFQEQRTTIKPLNSLTGGFRRINPKEDAIIALSFSNQPVVNILVKGANSSSILPIGTIVASNLDYTQFCTLNDITISTTDYSKPSWVPADGRTVPNSIYSKVSSSVPDLRGIFLRGKNQFFSSGEPMLIESHKDKGTRETNGFQDESIRPHDHQIEDKPHQHQIYVEIPGTPAEVTLQYHWNNIGHGPARDKLVQPAYTGITGTKLNEGEETRPKNVAVFYYIKIN